MTKRKDVPKKKKPVEAALSQAESMELQMILDRLGVQDPDGESFANYLESLRKMLKGREALVAGLLEKLSRTPNEVGFRTYLALENLVIDKQLARVNKQTAYRFAQKGFQGPGEAPAPEKVVLVQKEAKIAIAHRIVAPGALWFFSSLVPTPDDSAQIMVTALLEPTTREPYIRVAESPARVYKKFVEGLTAQGSEYRACEIPVEHAASLFFEMLKFRKGTVATQEITEASRRLRKYHDRELGAYAAEVMAGEGSAPDAGIPKVGEVVVQDDWAWILFSREELTPYRQKILDIDSSVLVVSPEIKRERVLDVVKLAAGDLCVSAKREFLTRYFEEKALTAKLCGDGEDAVNAWCVARHLKTLENPAESTFVQDVVFVSLATHWPEEMPEAEQEKKMDPYQATDSGLIIPR